jgi:hypothetical protein
MNLVIYQSPIYASSNLSVLKSPPFNSSKLHEDESWPQPAVLYAAVALVNHLQC